MNRRTRIATLVILAVLVALLGLGALPGLLKSGDPYYVTATVEGEWAGNGSAGLSDGQTAVNLSQLPERQYPYTTGAVAVAGERSPGRSDAYWKGPFGIKETFSHSPFDERGTIRLRHPSATTGNGFYVHDGDTLYHVRIIQNDG